MVFVILQVRCGATILKPWYGCSVPDSSSMTDVFIDFSSGRLDQTLPIPDDYQGSLDSVKAGRNKTDMIPVNSQCSVGEVVSSLGQYIDFAVSKAVAGETGPLLLPPARDAAAVLMQSSHSTCSLPKKWTIASPNKKLDLKNNIIGFLAKNKLGWSAAYAEQCGKAFVNILSDVLWYIDGNHHTLKDRGHGVPALFEAFQGYNKPEGNKKKRIDSSKLQSSSLLSHSASLFNLSGNSYMKRSQWNSVREAIVRLGEDLRKHAAYLSHQNELVQGNHAKKSCVRIDGKHPTQSPVCVW